MSSINQVEPVIYSSSQYATDDTRIELHTKYTTELLYFISFVSVMNIDTK